DTQLSLQGTRHLFRHVLLHARRCRRAPPDQGQEGHLKERLHPPCDRLLPHLTIAGRCRKACLTRSPSTSKMGSPALSMRTKAKASPTPPIARVSMCRSTAPTVFAA